jgi:hypothetical protein
MIKLLFGVLVLGSVSSSAGVKISCVDFDSFYSINPVAITSSKLSVVGRRIKRELSRQRKNARFSATINDRDQVKLKGIYSIDGLKGKISYKEDVSLIYGNGLIKGYLGGVYNNESGLEIEYDSDMSPLAAYGGSAIIGELGSVDLICYDVTQIMDRLSSSKH